jgi:ABC-type sugar transport system ATPase subunit
MSNLEIHNISKSFGSYRVVSEVNFAVEAGEFFVIVGPSGCGKSTLLRIICGLETPDSGRIVINHQDVTHTPPRERNVGMVFQDYGLYPNMDVYGNIAYGMQARGVRAEEIARRIPPVVERLGLVNLLKRNVVDLSGGEQQRVALARALAKDADVYLYDEPLSNLDPKLRGAARRDILWGHREKQKPSVYVTHDQIEAFSLADRIAVMGRGQLQQVGTPDEIIDTPRNLYVARFMGSPPINLFDGEVRPAGDGAPHFVSAGFDLALPERLATAIPEAGSARVVLGIRPAALALSDTTESDGPTLRIRVEDVEPMLGEAIVNGTIGPQSITAVLDDTDAENLAPGQNVTLSLSPDRILLFDTETEVAISA